LRLPRYQSGDAHIVSYHEVDPQVATRWRPLVAWKKRITMRSPPG